MKAGLKTSRTFATDFAGGREVLWTWERMMAKTELIWEKKQTGH